MGEIVHRRYKRVLEEQGEFPQLIIIDGGKGQLNAALSSLENLGLRNRIAVIGIAKKLEEIYYPNDPLPMFLNKKSESLKLIQQVRNEAHRFGITHHRKRREKGTLKTELTLIPGIGGKYAQGLLKHFRSVEGIRKASLEEIQKTIGKKKGIEVYGYFKNKKPDAF
jgi:excinuclease ABC subunit C